MSKTTVLCIKSGDTELCDEKCPLYNQCWEIKDGNDKRTSVKSKTV